MVQIAFFPAGIDNVTLTSGSTHEGDGGSHRYYVGNGGSGDYESFVKFTPNWAGVGRIVTATLLLYSDDGNGIFGIPSTSGTPKVVIRSLTSAFSGGSNGDGVFSAGDYTNPSMTTVNQKSAVMVKTSNGLNRIDITGIVNRWAPKTVRQSNGASGPAAANYGIAIEVYGGAGVSHRGNRWAGWSMAHTDASLRPKIELVYDVGVTTPNSPTNLTPAGAVTTLTTFQGDFTDIKPTDTLAARRVEVYVGTATNVGQVVSGGARVYDSGQQPASNSEIAATRFSLVSSNLVLTPLTTYKWRARVVDQEGQLSNWSDLVSFSVTNTAPDVPSISPDGGSYDSLNGILFRGTFHDADGDGLLAYQVEMSAYPQGDVHWDDPSFILWETGKVFVAAEVIAWPGASTTPAWQAAYGGQALLAGTYYWRARQWDSRDGLSDWSYASVVLTSNFDPGTGSQSTVQIDVRAPWRIVIRDMAANRGPGAVVAILENAKSVGASIVYNSPGELHFTLPIDHPQISVIEPKQTHYALETYSGDGWRETFAGVIWDIDATETSVVFFGIDYLGLFDYIFDERFDSSDIDKPNEKGGSKYVDKTITYVVNSQLARAVGLADSPVGFITVGSIATMSEKVTIWSTMAAVLPFVSGLIDSHRQGTGKNTRIQVVRTTTGAYQVRVVDDSGQEKPDLRMRYGELVQGYRVIPFGTNWAGLTHTIGRARNNALLVMYKSQAAPGIDPAVFGRIAQVQIMEGVADENDLVRRTKQAAIHAGKLGKQIALAIRSGVLGPLDGYDITDALPIEIIHGAVDTTRYGSGFWIVYALAWEAGDDGSTKTILTLAPRDDATPPDSDLIPSVPVSTQQGWQIHETDPDLTVTGGFWINSITGHIFEWDAANQAWVDMTDTLAGHPRILGTGIIEDPDFGQPLPGGQNVILNSGFELGNFATTADSLVTWDVAGDWTGTVVRTVTNISTGGSLTLTASTY